jgi:hypothetical protein
MLHLSRASPSRQTSEPAQPTSRSAILRARSSPESQTMISTITAEKMSAAVDPSAPSRLVDGSEPPDNTDSRSSSLSDLEDGNEERADNATKDAADLEDVQNDSEAETELLTPRKSNLYSHDANGPHTIEKSPSKLAQEVVMDALPTDPAESVTEDTLPPSSNLSIQASSPAPSKDALPIDTMDQIDHETESQNRKRKRSTSIVSSLSELDEPLAKRSHSSKLEFVAATSPIDDTIVPDVNEQVEIAENETPLADEPSANGITLEDEDSAAPPTEPIVPLKGRWPGGKGRKGKRKGGRKPFQSHDTEAAEPSDAVAEDDVDHVDGEPEEEGSSVDGEHESLLKISYYHTLTNKVVAKKRSAMDAFSGIEKEFAAFRERYAQYRDGFVIMQNPLTSHRHLNEQLIQVNRDLDLLRHNIHPEYLAQLKSIDQRRDEKVRYEDVNLRYKQESLRIKTVAERDQLHGQFFQAVRERRDHALERCYKDLFALQKDRRHWGGDETNFNFLYNSKRSQQIQQQTGYNLEVSILSGIAKHVGFPAAPDINGLQTTDIENDFQAMTVSRLRTLCSFLY